MSDAEFELELVEALNMLLEDERASVEMEVALASGATEYSEREALAAMGTQDIHFCEQLRTEMERAGLVVTPQINGVVFQVIGAERYDDRLRAFAHHQRVVAERARELQESNLEGALREALEGISLTHDHHTQWTEQRASEFAATRTLEFGGATRSGFPLSDDLTETMGDSAAPAREPEGDPTTLADAMPAEALPMEVPSVESVEPIEPIERVQPDGPDGSDELSAAADGALETGERVEESAAEPAESAEPTAARPRARATTRTSGATKPSTSRAKTPRSPRTTSAKSAATPVRRTRRTPKADEGENS